MKKRRKNGGWKAGKRRMHGEGWVTLCSSRWFYSREHTGSINRAFSFKEKGITLEGKERCTWIKNWGRRIGTNLSKYIVHIYMFLKELKMSLIILTLFNQHLKLCRFNTNKKIKIYTMCCNKNNLAFVSIYKNSNLCNIFETSGVQK